METDKKLFLAILNNEFSVIKDLINKKEANINATNSFAETPLIWAAKYASREIVEFLLEKGANKNYTDFDGKPALYYALLRADRQAGPVQSLLYD